MGPNDDRVEAAVEHSAKQGPFMRWTPGRLKAALGLYPPYLGAGVRVTHVDSEWLGLDVTMKLRWWNRNAVGTHFGGSLYSMVDPHLVLLLIQRLGSEYVVWDRSATIDFRKPGRGTVNCAIRISEAELEEIRRGTEDGAPHHQTWELEIFGEDDEVVARVTKVVYIRRRPPAPATP